MENDEQRGKCQDDAEEAILHQLPVRPSIIMHGQRRSPGSLPPGSPRDSRRYDYFDRGATESILFSPASSTFSRSIFGSRPVSSIQFGSARKTALNIGSDSSSRPTFTSETACQYFISRLSGIICSAAPYSRSAPVTSFFSTARSPL